MPQISVLNSVCSKDSAIIQNRFQRVCQSIGGLKIEKNSKLDFVRVQGNGWILCKSDRHGPVQLAVEVHPSIDPAHNFSDIQVTADFEKGRGWLFYTFWIPVVFILGLVALPFAIGLWIGLMYSTMSTEKRKQELLQTITEISHEVRRQIQFIEVSNR